jgi:hypothetical protein
MAELPKETVDQLEQDLEQVDVLSERAAHILNVFDGYLMKGKKIDFDKMESEIHARVDLDDREKMLVGRALEKLRNGVSEAEREVDDGVDNFFVRAKLPTQGYDHKPEIFTDDKYPSVVFLGFENEEDIKRFTKSFCLNNWTHFPSSSKGKNMYLDMMGLGSNFEGSNFGVVALYKDESGKYSKTSKTHEYSHHVQRVVKDHFHKYFGRHKPDLEKIPKGTRNKLHEAIGPRHFSRSMFQGRDNKKAAESLTGEQVMLDELRAYLISEKKPFPPDINIAPQFQDKMSQQMRRQYFQVHMRLTAAWIKSPKCFEEALSAIGASLSLAQASRLLDGVLGRHKRNLKNTRTRKKIRYLALNDHFLDYSHRGETLLTRDEIGEHIPLKAIEKHMN